MSIKFFSISDLDKTGGVKTLFTSSCDTAWNFEDDLARENFLSLGQQLDISLEDMVKSKQTHTNIVKVVTRENAGDGILRPIDKANAYDGLITNEKNLFLCTVEADCVPVYFYDPVKEVIAMVHSGWKGTVKKSRKLQLKKCVTPLAATRKTFWLQLALTSAKTATKLDKMFLKNSDRALTRRNWIKSSQEKIRKNIF